ncbi:aldo/keto reductase [Szabonella alba]|uniref:Aldo/keto reductase n=1 Tax=Szabonella alba TaxID=2804194 RepID=A0A8K0XZC8_9RHOB|nr:aldo/keto reductase [Szabonella alba]MBL4915662.1 aldo/keto reductase [Szabonella alba]
MQQRMIGGRSVAALGYGAMSFGGMYGATDEATSLACLDAMLEAGITHVDVANIYGLGLCETILGTWIASRKPDIVLATKAGIVNGTPRRADNSDAYLRAELEGSLKRLGVERVDLFYIHRREQDRPLDEVIGTLQRLEQEGKIGGYGFSEIAPETLRQAHAIHPCTAVQNEYSLWTRAPELGLLQECARLGVALVAFSPLARGMLGNRALDHAQVQDGFRGRNPRFTEPNFARNTARIDAFRAFCAARGWSTPATALAWVIGAGDHVIPIPGTRRAERLHEWLPLPDLSAADRAEIERVLPVGFAAGARYGEHQTLSVESYC